MSSLSAVEHRAVAHAAATEVLTARVGHEEYGLDILAVQEIRRYEPATRVANSPEHLLGVVDLRGVVVPIVDLRLHLGVPAAVGPGTVTVIVNVGPRTVGLVVDAVSEVVNLAAEQIRPPPAIVSSDRTAFIVGLVSLGSATERRMLLLVHLETLLQHF
ncbi:chemotaxis protein CheW [Ideonella sp. DXS29W]|uniref:Chemotaxis protein CheW n=1 Tax=Ideonella lacteola TaxID=2984193 RepID=A0ABU9BY29_9BURK